MARTNAIVLTLALALLSACADGPRSSTATTRSTTTTVPPAATTSTTGGTLPPSTTLPPTTTTSQAVAADLAALPRGDGALIAVVVDDVGGADTYFGAYLDVGVPLTFAIMPASTNAPNDAAAVAAAGHEAILHIPLPTAPNAPAPGGLGADAGDTDVAAYLDTALSRVPQATGIGHASRPWLLRNLSAVAPGLRAKGYRFAYLREVTNGLAGGLDVGVRATL